MRNRNFKLLIECFNKFLLNEHIGHTSQCIKLFNLIPVEFQPYINDTINWHNGDKWMSETDHLGNINSEDDEKLLFKEVAKACGCQVKDLLVNFEDNLIDDINYGLQPSSGQSDYFQHDILL